MTVALAVAVVVEFQCYLHLLFARKVYSGLVLSESIEWLEKFEQTSPSREIYSAIQIIAHHKLNKF